MESNGSLWKLTDVTTNSFEMINMSLVRAMTETRQGHDGLCYVHAAQGDHPLASPNKRLELGCVFRSTKQSHQAPDGRHVQGVRKHS